MNGNFNGNGNLDMFDNRERFNGEEVTAPLNIFF